MTPDSIVPPLVDPTMILIHHSLTADGSTVSASAIRRYHRDVLGWAMEGYHAFVELAGTEYEALIGRPWNLQGAHTKEQHVNSRSLSVCLVGDFDSVPPPHEQMIVLKEKVLVPWMEMYRIGPDAIRFHREFANYKSCPGNAFKMAYLGQYIPGVRPGI